MVRDFYCTACGAECGERHVDMDTVGMIADCPQCGKDAPLAAMCNGGTKSRYRFCDLSDNPLDYEGQCKLVGVGCHTADTDDVPDLSGAPVDARPRFDANSDAHSERREKIVYREKRKRGVTPVFFNT